MRRWEIDALEAMRRNLDVALWAYVVMPEHVHVLLFPRRPDYQMRQILAALKRPVSDAARDHLQGVRDEKWLRRLTVKYPSRRVFRFWQPGGGFDRNVFGDMSMPEVVDYIHENPVRRELVSKTTDWEWSSARFWAGWTDVPIRMDRLFA